MTTSCQAFRSLLELVLEGGAQQRELSQLEWHEHLLACGECRNLLQAEEALEILLATLPEPKLPPHLARRVVRRLRAVRRGDTRLDQLLELDREARAPERLAQSVLARLKPERERAAETLRAGAEAQLDRLLDLDFALNVPHGLAQRVISGLQAERKLSRTIVRTPASARARVQPEPRRRSAPQRVSADRTRTIAWMRSRWLYAAAAGILALLAGWIAWPRAEHTRTDGGTDLVQQQPTEPTRDTRAHGADGLPHEDAVRKDHSAPQVAKLDKNGQPDARMLAALDVLEEWDFLMRDDVDSLLSTLDPADDALLEYQEMESASQPYSEKEPEPPSKG